jgi:hypothetical protein
MLERPPCFLEIPIAVLRKVLVFEKATSVSFVSFGSFGEQLIPF